MLAFYRPCSFLCLFFITTFLSAQTISWQSLNGPRGVDRLLSLSDDNDGRVFAYVNETIYKSTDNGDSWAPCMTGISPGSITKFNRFQKPLAGPLNLFFKNGFFGNLVRYMPGTDSWASVPLPSGGSFVDLDIDPQGHIWVFRYEDFGLLHYSADNGQTYEQITTDNQLPGNFERMAAFDDEHCLVATSAGSVQTLYHVNRTGTVQQVLSGISLLYMGYNPVTGTAFYGGGGLNRSTDGGLSWQKVTTLPGQAANQNISNLIFGPSGEIWATTINGFTLYSADDGLSWTEFPNLKGLFSHSIRTDAGTWFVVNGCGFPQFGRSTDQGATWVDISDRFPYSLVEDIKKDATGNLYAWTCRREGYEISVDEGQSWSDYAIQDGAPVKVNSLAVRSDGMMLAVGENGKLYRSVDNGANWAKMPDIRPPMGLALAKRNRFHTGRNGEFYFIDVSFHEMFKSEDSGATWEKLNIFYPTPAKPAFHPNGDIFFVENYLYHYDAEKNSTTQLIVPGDPPLSTGIVHCTNSGHVFLSASSGAVLRKLTGNSAFEYLPFFFDKEVYKFESNLEGDVFAFSGNGIFKSDDGGNNWVNVGNTPKQPWKISASYVASDQMLYAAFYGDVIHRSTQALSEANFVSGRVWVDQNADCLYDTGELPGPFAAVTATGNGDYTSFPAYNGNFVISVPNGNYNLNVKAPNALFEPCFSDVPLSLNGPNDSASVDLPLKIVAACPYLTVNLTTPILRRCFDLDYAVFYKNEGTAPAPDAYVDITLDSFFIFQSATLPVASQNGFVYRFDLGTLEPGQSGWFNIGLKISCDAALGQTHCIAAHIFPDQVCLPTLQDRTQYSECRENIGAYDPNDKRAFVNGIEEPGYVLPNTEIEYLIRFQNTGTDTAFQVVIEDRLSTLLDLSSLRLLGASHPFTLELRDQRLLRFVFNNIMLPDSNINEAASHGFIKFALAQTPDLPLGALIQNGASIFFDFNDPIRTNDSKLIVGTVHQKPEPDSLYPVKAWPNPFENFLAFEIAGPDLPGPVTLRLFDALGRQRVQETFSGENYTIQRRELEPGLYYFVLECQGLRLGMGKVLAR